MPLDRLDEVRAFLAVVDAGSFTAAARQFQLTTNAVSLRVRRLESSLGVRLLVRTTRSVAMTEEGRRFHARVSRLVVELDAAEAELKPAASAWRGTVRLALPGVVASGVFLRRLQELLDEHPGLAVQLRVSSTPIMPASAGLDITVVVGRPPQTAFVGRLLGRVTWVLAAAPAYLARRGRPRRPEDLQGHRCLRLLASPPQDEWTLVDRRGREIAVPVAGSYEADDSRSLGDATYAGIGIGVRPAGECARAELAGSLERVLPEYRFQPLDVFALLPAGRARIPRVAACLEALRTAVQELA